jgi:hypothetical protein
MKKVWTCASKENEVRGATQAKQSIQVEKEKKTMRRSKKKKAG